MCVLCITEHYLNDLYILYHFQYVSHEREFQKIIYVLLYGFMGYLLFSRLLVHMDILKTCLN